MILASNSFWQLYYYSIFISARQSIFQQADINWLRRSLWFNAERFWHRLFNVLYFLYLYIYYSDQQSMTSYTLSRSFVLEKEVCQQTQILKGDVQVKDGFANLQPILRQIGDPDLFKFKIYDFVDNKYHEIRDYIFDDDEIQKNYNVPAQLLRTDIVLMKFILDASETSSMKSGSQSASDASSVKKQRSKERTIAEVIQIVKQWRDIHTNSGNGKKVNLQESAEMLGISKKSLDDYYYQLRLGEKYDFDFSSHLNDKVGVLRTFIKDIKSSKKDSRSKVQKHPKKLKIIQQLGQLNTKPTRSKTKRSKNSRSQSSEEQPQPQHDNNEDNMDRIEQKLEQQNKKEISSIQNQFYNEFEFMVEEPPDPFLNFQCDFKKKSYDDFSNQLFF